MPYKQYLIYVYLAITYKSILYIFLPSVLPKTPQLTASTGTALTVTKNAPETLTCHTDSKGTVTYTYYSGGHEISHAGHGSTYKVPTSSTGNRSSYTCAVTISGAQSATSSALAIQVVGEYV